MKKFFILFCLFPVYVSAQHFFEIQNHLPPDSLKNEPIVFSVMLGGNISKLKSDTLTDTDPVFLPEGGLNLTHHFGNKFSLAAGVQLSGRGYNSTSPYLKQRNFYFDVPIIATYHPFRFLSVDAGLQQAFVISSTIKFIDGGQKSGYQKVTNTGYKSQSEFIAGLTFPIQKKVDLGIRYALNHNSIQYSNFQICVHIRFGENSFNQATSEDRMLAGKQIKMLKAGILLVRLHTYSTTIDALNKNGKTKEAMELQNSLTAMNRNIIDAFTRNFNFCPVYYFYSEITDSIKAGNLSRNILDAALNVAPDTVFDQKYIFVADFSETDPNLYQVEQHIANTTQTIKRNTNYSSSNIALSGLIIRDSKMVQLRDPFPYYVRVLFSDKIIEQKKINDAVIKMNANLKNFNH